MLTSAVVALVKPVQGMVGRTSKLPRRAQAQGKVRGTQVKINRDRCISSPHFPVGPRSFWNKLGHLEQSHFWLASPFVHSRQSGVTLICLLSNYCVSD